MIRYVPRVASLCVLALAMKCERGGLHGERRADLGRTPVHGDGPLHAEVTVPPDAPIGPAGFSVTGSAFDRCADSRSCPGYGVSIEVIG